MTIQGCSKVQSRKLRSVGELDGAGHLGVRSMLAEPFRGGVIGHAGRARIVFLDPDLDRPQFLDGRGRNDSADLKQLGTQELQGAFGECGLRFEEVFLDVDSPALDFTGLVLSGGRGHRTRSILGNDRSCGPAHKQTEREHPDERCSPEQGGYSLE